MSAGNHKTRIKVLFLAANPRDTQRLDLDREVAKIKERLSDSRLRDKFDLQQEWVVRLDELSRFLLHYRPHVVHFSGHGSSTGELIFEDAAGSASASAPQAAIANLFRILKDDIRLVVLNACFSEGQARAIAQHIDCVIGTSAAIGDQVAVAFAAGFYRAISFNRDVKTAFDLGRNEIEIGYGVTSFGRSEHLIPKLVTREGIDPKNITLYSMAKKRGRLSKRAKVSVLSQSNLVETKTRSITGLKVKPGEALPVNAEIRVLGGSRVKKSNLGDITGLDLSTGTPENAQ